jgi:hypothetical protein
MKMHNISRFFSRFSVVYLSLFAPFLFILGWIESSLGNVGILILAVAYCCALTPLSFLTGGWLIWMNREQFSKTFIWLAFQLIFLLSMALYSVPVVDLFFESLLFLLFPFLVFVNFWYAFRKGATLKLVGWGSFGLIWSLLVAWRIKGNLFEEMISSIGTNTNNLWWLYALMYGFVCMVVAGAFAFFIETVQILGRELSVSD